MSQPPDADRFRRLLEREGVTVPEIAPAVHFDAELLMGFPVGAAAALDVWEAIRGTTERTGLYPVLLVDGNAYLGGDDLGFGTVPAILAAAGRIDAAARLKRPEVSEELEGLEEGEWVGGKPSNEFALLDSGSGRPREDVRMLLLPTRAPWEAAAHLRWSAPNYNINPEDHVAVHRYWHERYGAELVAVSGDVLEMRVARPPRDRAGAMALAWEQSVYCPDIVMQGTGTVAALAGLLLGAGVWFFWWD